MDVNSVVYEAMHFSARPLHAVVAADDDATRRLVAATLRGQGLEVTEVSPSAAVLSRAAQPDDSGRAADLFVVEADLKDRGLDLLRGLRGIDGATPILALSPHLDPKVANEADALGVVSFEPPFDYAELCAAALDMLDPL